MRIPGRQRSTGRRLRAISGHQVTRGVRVAAKRDGRLGQDAAAKSADLARQMRRLDVPWARSAPSRAVRAALLVFVLGPLIAYYVRARRRGHERFAQLTGPVVLVSNHSSHLDTPAILRALPAAWRRRTVVAAAADHFYQRRSVASGVSLLFNTVPVSRAGGGADGLEHIQELVADGWNLLIYAEGTRSRDGSVGRMHSGAALVAQRHQISIVPVRVTGTRAAMPPSASWPHRIKGRLLSHRHQVEVAFGAPVAPRAGETPAQLMARVSAFYATGADDPRAGGPSGACTRRGG
jgi:1-acyl-sn-glycerol-3-phosphate acyltransferase